MLTRASSSSKPTKFNRPEQEVLVKLNQRLKLAEVTDKKAEILGAINRIGYSAEKMATFCNKLDEVIKSPSVQTSRFSVKHLWRKSSTKEPELTKEVAIELRDQITKAFPIAAFSLKLPAPGDVLDIMLESYVTGAYRHRFYQVDAVDKFLNNITSIQKEVLRSLVTGLRGIGNFRNVKSGDIYPEEDPFKDLSFDKIKPLIKTPNNTEEEFNQKINELSRFEGIGIRAYALLSEKTLCYNDIESTLKDWGAASSAEDCPAQQIIKQLEADFPIPEKQEKVLKFIGDLNQLIVKTIELGVEFEYLRNDKDAAEITAAEKTLTKNLLRAPSAYYAESKIAIAENYYEKIGEKELEKKDIQDQPQGATAGASEETQKKEIKSKGATGSFSGLRSQSLKFKEKKIEQSVESEVQANKLPLGFAYQDNEYVYQGDARSAKSLYKQAALSVDLNKPAKKCMEHEFILFSDGMYRMKGNPYYMLIDEHIYSSDLAYELVKKEALSHETETEGASQTQFVYETVKVLAGLQIQLTDDIKVTTPVKIVPDATEPSTRLVVQGKEEETSSSDQASSSKSE